MDGVSGGLAPALIGRAAQLACINEALAGLVEGRGAALSVIGEPGVGKTRLLQETVRCASQRGVRVLRGRSSGVGPAVPFRPVAEMFMALARSGECPDLSGLGPYRAVLGRLVPDWSQAGTPAGESSVLVLAEAVLRLLAVIGVDTGCLLVLDDLHDADAETLAVVDYLVDNVGNSPVVVLAAMRDEPSDALGTMQTAAARGAVVSLHVDRLTQAQVVEVAGDYLDVRASALPAELVQGLWQRTAGLPLAVEELLKVLVASGALSRGPDGWRFTDRVERYLPETLLRSVSGRLDRMGPKGRAVLIAAAVLGVRFPVAVVQDVTGLGDREFVGYLRMAVHFQLVQAEEPLDWYGFRHPLLAEAVVHDTPPGRLSEFAARAADAVQRRFPDLPGHWCQLTAGLRLAAGELVTAGIAFAEAGRRALDAGAPDTAVRLLERADELLASGDRTHRLVVLRSLVPALAEVGRLTDAVGLVAGISISTPEQADGLARLHMQLARALCDAGCWTEARRLLVRARALLTDDAPAADLVALDVWDSMVALGAPGAAAAGEVVSRARIAVEVAERLPLPEVAVDGWQVLALADRSKGTAAQAAYYRRALQIAERHGLADRRARLLVLLANARWMELGDIAELIEAGAEAERQGLVVLSLTAQANLALDAAQSGRFDRVDELVDQCLPTVRRLGMSVRHRHLLVTRAAQQAHQGRRAGMEVTLVELGKLDDGDAEVTLARGLAVAFCSLVEGRTDQARIELADVAGREQRFPTPYQLTGTHGLAILLAVLDGEPLDLPASGAVARRLRWNHHWVALAEAVQHGRAGRTAQATDAWAEAEELGSIYPTALHLGRWLVGERAQRDGWADGAALRRSAESHFRDAGCPGVVNAARASLRSIGATVPQHRTGSERVPSSLRARGVTVREYEVLELLLERASNKEIGARLHISHRTVEKHVASLITKTDLPDRSALRQRAEQLVEPAGA